MQPSMQITPPTNMSAACGSTSLNLRSCCCHRQSNPSFRTKPFCSRNVPRSQPKAICSGRACSHKRFRTITACCQSIQAASVSDSPKMKVGFVGLGIMGKAMVRRQSDTVDLPCPMLVCSMSLCRTHVSNHQHAPL